MLVGCSGEMNWRARFQGRCSEEKGSGYSKELAQTVEPFVRQEIPHIYREIAPANRISSREFTVDSAASREGLPAGSISVSTGQAVLPTNPLSNASANVLEVTDSSSPDLTGSGTDEDRSGTRH
ncbi:hypothetical protein Bca101_059631 [Brassica carinata]